MPKNLTKDQEIDEALEDVRKAMKANFKARAELVKCELEIKHTHHLSVKANERLRALQLETYI